MTIHVLLALLFAMQSASSQRLWVSWDTFEPDTCASIWLIKRHIDPTAVFRFLPKGTPVTEGTPFDMPDAKLRRYATSSTYETILKEFRVTDRTAREIGAIVHDIEINKWARKSTAELIEVEKRVRGIVAAAKSHTDLVENTLTYFDQLAADTRKKHDR